MKQGRVLNLLLLLVFLVSSALRLGLAIVNRDPDDVVGIILLQKRLPLTGECEECFQPKLYYFLAAETVEAAKINLSHKGSIALALQLMNFAAGEAVVILAYVLIKRLKTHSEQAGLLVFTLLAFNPALMATSGMTGNDIFTILFSSVAIYFCWEFLQNNKIGWLVVSGLFLSVSLATKTNAWSTALAIFLILFIKAITDKRLSSIFNGLDLFVCGAGIDLVESLKSVLGQSPKIWSSCYVERSTRAVSFFIRENLCAKAWDYFYSGWFFHI